MTCKHCGMDSRTTHECEWCKKPLGGGLTPMPSHAPRVALTGEILDGPRPLAPLEQIQPMPVQPRSDLTGMPVPPSLDQTQPVPAHLDVTQPVHHPGMAGGVALPSQVPGGQQKTSYLGRGGPLPAAALDTSMARTMAASGRSSSTGERWEKFLAIAMPLMLISVVIIHFAPNAFLWVSLADFFLVGLAMGGTAVISSYDDSYLDCGVVLVVCYFFGPIIGLAVYGLVALIKQEINGAIAFLLLGHIAIRLLLLFGFAASADAFTILPQMMLMNIAGFLSVCASFAGWILSSFFRPLDE